MEKEFAPIYFKKKGVLKGKRVLLGQSRYAKAGLKWLKKKKKRR